MPISSTGNNAFTLVELIVVIVIISILATMVVPRLSGAARAASLRESARRLVTAARYARDFAATRRRDCRLTVDRQRHRYELTYQSHPSQAPGEFLPLSAGIGRAEQLPAGVRFGQVRIESRREAASSRQDDFIVFRPSGQSDAAVVQITDGRRTYSMLVEPVTGRARTVEGAVSQPPTNRKDLDD